MIWRRRMPLLRSTVAALCRSGYQRLPLKKFPSFHATPFKQEKFLSVKSRSLETFTKSRCEALQRCAALTLQLASAPAVDAPAAAAASPGAAHPAALAEELLAIQKKVQDLTLHQGFVLSDELVYRMFNVCVRCGAPRLAVEEWLHDRIVDEGRGPPYPACVLAGMTAVLTSHVLPRLPESGNSFTGGSMLAAMCVRDGGADAATPAQADVATAVRLLRSGVGRGPLPLTTAALCGPPYLRSVVRELLVPVWRAAEAMHLTFKAEVGDDCEERCSEATVPPQSAQRLAVNTTLMVVSPLSTFEGDENGALRHYGAPEEAVLVPLNSILDFYVAVGQCAAEAKHLPLLHALHKTVCDAFFCCADVPPLGDAVPCINEAAWCQYTPPRVPARRSTAVPVVDSVVLETTARRRVHSFLNDVLSLIYYARLGALQEGLLWQVRDLHALVVACDGLVGDGGASRGAAEAEDVSQLLTHTFPQAVCAAVQRQLWVLRHGAKEDSVTRRILAGTLVPTAPDGSAPHLPPHTLAEGAMYAALALGDEALLHQAASSTASCSGEQLEMQRLATCAVAQYAGALRAMADGVTGEDGDGENGLTAAWEAALQLCTAQMGDVSVSLSDMRTCLHGCLQVLVTCCAAEQVRAVHLSAGSAAARCDSNGGGDTTESEHHGDMLGEWMRLRSAEERVMETLVGRVEELMGATRRFCAERSGGVTLGHDTWAACWSPSALGTVAMVCVAAAVGPSPTAHRASTSLCGILHGVAEAARWHLATATASGGNPSAVAGNWVEPLLVVLAQTEMWPDLLLVLQALIGAPAASEGCVAGGATVAPPSSLLCAAAVDPSAYAFVYGAAQAAGAARICSLLRVHREQLFY